MSELERTNLEAHVDICMMRHKRLEEKLEIVESDVKSIRDDISKMEEKLDQDHKELMESILSSNKEKFKVLVGTAGTVIAALLTVVGYVVVNFKYLLK